MNNPKWIKTDDNITGSTIYYLDGYEYGNNLLVRIFKDKIMNRISMKKEFRYFPIIENEYKEEQIQVGSEQGYKTLQQAKQELIKAFNQYQGKGLESFVS